ncbi:MAG TPA: hypothetical protein VK814_02885 [Acidobacteriaceae bacterium]|jgi:hypothetical protein|nr:hypothetical protein [Acidobacteriaceae bacterium]
MSTFSEIPPGMQPVEPKQGTGRWTPLWYAIAFVVVQLGALTTCFIIAAHPWFLTHDDYPGVYQAGYGMRLTHADCEVVLYGDSSALTGLDPQLIEKSTGLKTCNVAESAWVQALVGFQFPLDEYLRRNKRPRFILMMLTPPEFLPGEKPLDFLEADGMLYAFQYDHDPAIVHGLLHRPMWVLNFTLWAGKSIFEHELKQLFPSSRGVEVDTRKQRADRHGIWQFPFPPEVSCNYTRHDPRTVKRDAAGAAATRKRYGVDGTQVIVDISPISNCNPYADVYRRKLDGLHDNALVALPMPYFNDADEHFSVKGSAYISTEAANQILALMRQDNTAHQAQPAGALSSQ